MTEMWQIVLGVPTLLFLMVLAIGGAVMILAWIMDRFGK